MKLRFLALFLALLMIVPMVSLAEEMMWVKTPNGKSVNMRAEPRSDAAILCQIPYGKAVTMHNPMLGSNFFYCTYKGHTGYINSNYLSHHEPAPKPTPKPTAKPTSRPTATPAPVVDNRIFKGFEQDIYLATVTPSEGTHTVNLRWGPSKSTPVRTVMEGGATLLVVARNSAWSQVYDLETGVSGFMMTEFLIYASEYDPHAVGAQHGG